MGEAGGANDEVWQMETIQGLQEGFINSSTVSFLPEEKLDGVDCYVLNITPKSERLSSLIGKDSGMDEQTLDNIISASVIEWIDKESFYTRKVVLSVDMNESGKTVRMETIIVFSDYGAEQMIRLPPEAINAKTLGNQTQGNTTRDDTGADGL